MSLAFRFYQQTRKKLLFIALVAPSSKPDVEIVSFHLIEVEKQNKQLEVISSKADLFQEEKLGKLENPQTFVWGQHEKPYEIKGNEGVIHTERQDLRLNKNCSVVSPDGIIFRTESLFYEHAAAKIRSDDDVLTQRNAAQLGDFVELTGKGLVIDVENDVFEVLSNVRAQRRQKGNKNLRILSSRSKMMPNRDLATFTGNVRVYSDEMEMFGHKLQAHLNRSNPSGNLERLELEAQKKEGEKIIAKLNDITLYSQAVEIFFAENGEFETMEAIGAVDAETSDGVKIRGEKLEYRKVEGKLKLLIKDNVFIETADRTARCQEAEIDPESGAILLERVATVKQGDQVLRGERIRFSTKNSQVFVEKASGEMLRQNLGF